MSELVIDNYVISTPIKEILENLRSSLTNGKLKVIKKRGDHISVTCPHHSDGAEANPSCGIYIGDNSDMYGRFNCFTCGEKGSFIHFVALCFDSSDSYAKKWLIDNYGKLAYELNLNLKPIKLDTEQDDRYLDESMLDTFQDWHPYMDKRKLSKKVCEMFKVKYDPKSECLVFPVWDERGKLWMLTRRSVKSKHFYIDENKEKPVYLMNFIRDKKLTEVTVVESQINALTGWSWGVPMVATFGCNVTPEQMEIFNKSGITHIYVCFDGDGPGRKGTKNFIDSLNKDIFVDVIEMPLGKDVNDLTEEEFNNLTILSSQEWEDKYYAKSKGTKIKRRG